MPKGFEPMTREAAIANQEQIVADGYRLEWWYGTDCEKCCGVYPKFMTSYVGLGEQCYYQCEVCGKRTKGCDMSHFAADAWNRHEYLDNRQMTIFEIEEGDDNG